LYQIFKNADEKYNSELFDLKKDQISKNLLIDKKVIKSIVEQLYYPECPYEFSVLSVEILGSAYEQFLGKQIKIGKYNKATIEEKPEVRKAGGVYYTPQYIVDYIVENTVGKLIQDKSVDFVSKIKVLDPACGSGSFLIGAYQYLLEWHKNYYGANTKASKGSKNSPVTPEGNLTTAEKKRILLNNIYGVDIDVNAVEVTKLSLLLKCLEGETEASIKNQLSLFNERVLLTLDDNIKSGNSLIDFDFYDSQIDFGHERKIKPFNWQKAFPQVFNSSNGFDVIIGNPPWVDIKGHMPELVKYYFEKYTTCSNRINLYAIFVEKSLKLMNDTAKFGFIIPNSILYQSSYRELRKWILKDFKIESIIRLPDNTFHDVKAETLILTIGKSSSDIKIVIYDRQQKIDKISHTDSTNLYDLDKLDWQSQPSYNFDIFNDESRKILLNKIEKTGISLETICDFTLGITPYDKYKGHTPKQIEGRVFHSTIQKDANYKPLLAGADVKKYFVQWGGSEYISYGNWLAAPRDPKFFIQPRILIRQIISGDPFGIYAAYTEDELYNTQSIFNLVLKDEMSISLKYLLGLINSSLLNFYHRNRFLDISKILFQKILIQNCKKFPIVVDETKKQEQLKIISLVEQLSELIKEKQKTILLSRHELLQGKIDYCENTINKIVYDLYELTSDEIKIIERKVGE